MSVKIEASGRRSVETEFEVVGTPEQVWQAIATGPGVSSWFVPTEFEERDGRPVAVTYHFSPDMEPKARVTGWDPPRAFTQEADGWFPDSPPIAAEWRVQARAGGICTLRIVHSLFASTDAWDDQLEGTQSGWSGFLATLRIYLAHFQGQPLALAQLRNPAAGTDAEIWDAMTSAFGLQQMQVGQRFVAPAGVPPFSGVVEYVSEDPYDAQLQVEQPAPGIIAFGVAGTPGGPSSVGVNLYMYGGQADAVLARVTPVWEAWLKERFPEATNPPPVER
jgi:uncharacterized protein YndB with AHSA1/START domain